MHARFLSFLFLLFLASVTSAGAQQSAGFETKAKQLYLVDAETGTVLFSKDENAPVPPASLAKLMTMDVVFEALRKGEITEDTEYTVSEHAWRTGGAPSGTSTMFAALKSRVRVGDLIRGVVVQFANDACIILAEGLMGSEAAFAERMTARARDLGLHVARFNNATGLPDPENRITMRELVMLARHIQETYPDDFALYAQPEFEWNKIMQRNRNPLVAANIGVDGFAAGFAEGYGYGMVATMERDGRRVFLAIGGLETNKDRIEETRRVLDWAMSAFEKKRIFKAGEVVGEARLYGGDVSSVPLAVSAPVDVLLPVNNRERLNARVIYTWPPKMPVTVGQQAGTLKIWNGETLLREVPVQTTAEAGPGTLSSRALDALQELLFFWL